MAHPVDHSTKPENSTLQNEADFDVLFQFANSILQGHAMATPDIHELVDHVAEMAEKFIHMSDDIAIANTSCILFASLLSCTIIPAARLPLEELYLQICIFAQTVLKGCKSRHREPLAVLACVSFGFNSSLQRTLVTDILIVHIPP